MWISGISRKDLLTFAEGRRLASTVHWIDSFDSPVASDSAEMRAVWEVDPREQPTLPLLLIIDSRKRRDLLAWTWTYMPAFRPLTGLLRVVDSALAERVLGVGRARSMRAVDSACAGLILGELALYQRGPVVFDDIAASQSFATAGFFITRALAMGLHSRDVDAILENWVAARALTRQSALSISAGELRGPWRVIEHLAETDGDSARASTTSSDTDYDVTLSAGLELAHAGDLAPDTWRRVTKGFGDQVADLVNDPSATREERVVAFDRAAKIVGSARADLKATGAFILGYLANQVGPGTFDHHSLLAPLTADPRSILWYGLCAGLRPGSAVQSYALGMGRRILREAVRIEPRLDRPRCDIAFPELEVAVAGENPASEFRSSRPNLLDVELAPGVVTTVRWPPRPEPSRQQTLFLEKSAFPTIPDSRLLADLAAALERTRQLTAQVQAIMGDQRKPPLENVKDDAKRPRIKNSKRRGRSG